MLRAHAARRAVGHRRPARSIYISFHSTVSPPSCSSWRRRAVKTRQGPHPSCVVLVCSVASGEAQLGKHCRTAASAAWPAPPLRRRCQRAVSQEPRASQAFRSVDTGSAGASQLLGAGDTQGVEGLAPAAQPKRTRAFASPRPHTPDSRVNTWPQFNYTHAWEPGHPEVIGMGFRPVDGHAEMQSRPRPPAPPARQRAYLHKLARTPCLQPEHAPRYMARDSIKGCSR